jgi:hypothetical protein
LKKAIIFLLYPHPFAFARALLRPCSLPSRSSKYIFAPGTAGHHPSIAFASVISETTESLHNWKRQHHIFFPINISSARLKTTLLNASEKAGTGHYVPSSKKSFIIGCFRHA